MSSTAPPPPADPTGEALRAADAGGRVVRGGIVRAGGYVAGFAIAGLTSVLLLRYLGVDDFGRFTTIAALMAVVSGVTDAGLTAIGSRELSLAADRAERARLLGNLVTLRLLVTPLGVLVATLFAVVAGYERELVLGALLAGSGVLLVNAQATMMLPLSVDLRLGTVTAVEVLKQLLTLAGIALLVLLGAGLLPFFGVQVGVGIVVLALTPLLVGLRAGLRPRFDRPVAGRLLREALPLAAAITMNVIYFRVLVIMMSLLASTTETGLFATSFRIFEVLFGLPQLVLSVALPLLAVAGREDLARLRGALQSMTDTALFAGAGMALVIAVAAEPVLVILGGEEYREAGPVLALQALALVPIFVGQAWQMVLVSVGRQKALLVANSVALAVVVVLGLVLIPAADARGAAVAAVVAELVLGAALFAALVRGEPSLAPRLGHAARVLVATAAGALAGFALPIPALAAAVVAGLVYAGVGLAVRAVPPELLRALPVPLPGRA